MGVISKHEYYSKIGPQFNCSELFDHRFTNCVISNLYTSFEYFIYGVFKFYIPVYILKLCLDYKKINRKYWKKFVFSYFRSECFGVSYAFLVMSSVCFFNALLGRIHYYTIAFIPGVISGLSILCETKRNRLLNATLWSTLIIEALLENAYYFKIIKKSKEMETLLFMSTTSLLMHFIAKIDRKDIPISLWFYYPKTRNKTNKYNLRKYLQEIMTNFGIGYALSTSRSLFAKLNKISKENAVRTLFDIFLNKSGIKFSLVFGVYVALFRSVLLGLQKNNISTAPEAIAGFIAGISYYIKPTSSLLATAVVTLIHIFYKHRFSQNPNLQKIPFHVIVYMLSNGVLLHNRVAASMTCPGYYSKLLKVATGGFFNMQYEAGIRKYIAGQ